ncbi:MAG: hypothetical protein JSW73_02910 [Candidatus Woesearchaeota archaeon]|nr:MAG: hypothetical protein JSW73_02910 [Candidatus Woesearchaeota archaeon]
MECSIGWIKTRGGFLLFKSREINDRTPILFNFIKKSKDYISFEDKNVSGSWFGVNKKGIGIASAIASYRGSSKDSKCTNIDFKINKSILNKAKSVEEATQEYLKIANKDNLCNSYDIIIGDKKHANIIEILPNKTNITTYYDSVFRTTHLLNMKEYKKHRKQLDRSKAKLRKVIELTKKVKTPDDVVSILNFHHKNGLKDVRRQHYGSDVGSVSAEWKNNEVVLYHVLNK